MPKQMSNKREPLTPEAEKFLQIIMDPRNDPSLPAEDRLEFMKQEFLKPENASLQHTADCILWEFGEKGYVATRPGFIPLIPAEVFLQSLRTLSELDQLGVCHECPDSELDPRAYRQYGPYWMRDIDLDQAFSPQQAAELRNFARNYQAAHQTPDSKQG